MIIKPCFKPLWRSFFDGTQKVLVSLFHVIAMNGTLKQH